MPKHVVVIVAGQQFSGSAMNQVFVQVVTHLGKKAGWEVVEQAAGEWVVRDIPLHVKDYEKKYVVREGWWVRKHGSADALAGALARLGSALSIPITVDVQTEGGPIAHRQ